MSRGAGPGWTQKVELEGRCWFGSGWDRMGIRVRTLNDDFGVCSEGEWYALMI